MPISKKLLKKMSIELDKLRILNSPNPFYCHNRHLFACHDDQDLKMAKALIRTDISVQVQGDDGLLKTQTIKRIDFFAGHSITITI